MYCKNCGSELPAGTKYCPNCGEQTGNEKPVQNVFNRFGRSASLSVVISVGILLSAMLLPMLALTYKPNNYSSRIERFTINMLGDNYTGAYSVEDGFDIASRITFVVIVVLLISTVFLVFAKRKKYSFISSGAIVIALIIYRIVIARIWLTNYYPNTVKPSVGFVLCMICAIALTAITFFDARKEK